MKQVGLTPWTVFWNTLAKPERHCTIYLIKPQGACKDYDDITL